MNTLTIAVSPNEGTVGNTVTLGAVLREDTAVTDPMSVTLVVTDPTSSSITYAWPTASGLEVLMTRTTVGTFTQDVSITSDGMWAFVWTTVTPTVVVSSGFFVPALLEQVTITTQTSDSVAIVGTYVEVRPSTGTETTITSGFTNSSGQLVKELAPGNYEIFASLIKTLFPNPTSFTVLDDSTPQMLSIVGTPLAITTTGTVALTKLYGQVIDLSGIYRQGMRIEIESLSMGDAPDFLPPTSGTITGTNPVNLQFSGEKRELLTDGDGYWEADVVQGTQLRVSIPDIHFSKVVRIPLAVNNPNYPLLNIADCRTDINGPPLGIDHDTGSVDF